MSRFSRDTQLIILGIGLGALIFGAMRAIRASEFSEGIVGVVAVFWMLHILYTSDDIGTGRTMDGEDR